MLGLPSTLPENSHPIIIVSSSPTALLTMWNIKRFLEDGMYIAPLSLSLFRLSLLR
jgi:hypothetical protein